MTRELHHRSASSYLEREWLMKDPSSKSEDLRFRDSPGIILIFILIFTQARRNRRAASTLGMPPQPLRCRAIVRPLEAGCNAGVHVRVSHAASLPRRGASTATAKVSSCALGLGISDGGHGSLTRGMTQRHCSPPLSTRRRVAARGWMPRSNIAITPYHMTPRCAGQGGGNVARPYCAERRRSGVATTLVGVSQTGRCLVPAPFRYGTRHNRTVYVRRDGANARSSVPPSRLLVRTASPLSDPESRAPTLRAIERGSLDAPAACRVGRRRGGGPLDRERRGVIHAGRRARERAIETKRKRATVSGSTVAAMRVIDRARLRDRPEMWYRK